MIRSIVFHRAARTEFHDARDYYEKQKPGLGDRFSDRVHEILNQLASTPEMHQQVYKDVRRAIVRGFPYSVMYRIKPDRVRVISVFHGHRDPSIWQRRA